MPRDAPLPKGLPHGTSLSLHIRPRPLPHGPFCYAFIRASHKRFCSCAVCCASLLSHVWRFVAPWTVAHQAPLSLRILQARTLAWVAMPSSGDHPNPGIEHRSPALQIDSLPAKLSGKPSLSLPFCNFPYSNYNLMQFFYPSHDTSVLTPCLDMSFKLIYSNISGNRSPVILNVGGRIITYMNISFLFWILCNSKRLPIC